MPSSWCSGTRTRPRRLRRDPPPRHRLGYSPQERAGADACAGYLENKQDYLGYPAFLKAGRPVASGLIEGAAHWLVKNRMQVTGARWSLDGAEAVLRLRALAGSGDLDDYWRLPPRTGETTQPRQPLPGTQTRAT